MRLSSFLFSIFLSFSVSLSIRVFSLCLLLCLSVAQGFGVLVLVLATSLFEHLSMGQANSPPTQTMETGLPPLARTHGRTKSFLERLHVKAHCNHSSRPCTSATWI